MPRPQHWIASFVLIAFVTIESRLERSSTVSAQEGNGSTPRQAAATQSEADIEFFEKRIRPILSENCWSCHGPEKQKAGLRLDSRPAMTTGGEGGSVLDSDNPAASLLLDAISYTGDYKMPPAGKLSDAAIADLTHWVNRGSPWPTEAKPTTDAAAPKSEFNLESRRAAQWCFQPLQAVEPPTVSNAGWPITPEDRFILAKLEAAGIKPAPRVERLPWLRRVTFDLVGLPPTPDEIAAFLADASPHAEETVVDRLLASPHYGERWGRHWLDLVRFAETRGHEFDFPIPNAYEYRDYVIRAFNADLPYDRFVVEQLAGDLLAEPRRHPTERFNESLIGTGFWHLGEGLHSPVDVRSDEADRIDNQIDVFGKAILSMTIGCARCHDHKFDAIATRDYYSLAGYLQSSRYDLACIDDPAPRRATIVKLERLLTAGRLQFLTDVQRPTGTAEEWRRLLLGARELFKSKSANKNDAGPDEPAAESDGGDSTTEAAKPDLNPHPLQVELSSERPGSPGASPLTAWGTWCRWPDEDFATFVQRVLSPRERAAGNSSAAGSPHSDPAAQVVYADFTSGPATNWIATGDAFSKTSASILERLAVSKEGGLRQPLFAGSFLDTASTSRVLRGSFRSPTFEITHPRIVYRAAGEGCRIRLIVDGLQLIQNPIYGGLSIGVDSPGEFRQFEQDVSKWVGHRAYIEFLDDGEGWLAVQSVTFTSPQIPAPTPQPHWLAALPASAVESPDAFAAWIANRLAVPDSRPTDSFPETPADVVFDRWTFHGPGSWLEAIADGQAHSAAAAATQVAELESQIQYRRFASVMVDGTGEDEHIFLRGNPRRMGDVAPRQLPLALAGEQPAPASGSGRLEMAERLVTESGPYIARVVVNRVWHHHFGAGLVRTPDDFGNMGQPPSHPELLDWLAQQFIRDGWSFKKLHRRLVLSQTYHLGSEAVDSDAELRDPKNELLHRRSLQRLQAEAIRDAILTVSGRLDRTPYGPSIPVNLTPFMVGRGRPGESGPLDGAGRRSIYIAVRRNFLVPFFMAFDFPTPFTTIGRRSVSNVPSQSLALMNNPFILQQAGVWAERMLKEHNSTAARIEAMYLAAFGRLPVAAERDAALQFVTPGTASNDEPTTTPTNDAASQPLAAAELERWTDLAHALFNVQEFVFVP